MSFIALDGTDIHVDPLPVYESRENGKIVYQVRYDAEILTLEDAFYYSMRVMASTSPLIPNHLSSRVLPYLHELRLNSEKFNFSTFHGEGYRFEDYVQGMDWYSTTCTILALDFTDSLFGDNWVVDQDYFYLEGSPPPGEYRLSAQPLPEALNSIDFSYFSASQKFKKLMSKNVYKRQLISCEIPEGERLTFYIGKKTYAKESGFKFVAEVKRYFKTEGFWGDSEGTTFYPERIAGAFSRLHSMNPNFYVDIIQRLEKANEDPLDIFTRNINARAFIPLHWMKTEAVDVDDYIISDKNILDLYEKLIN